MLGSPPSKPPHDYSYMRTALKSAMIMDALVKSGVADVRGVWADECGGGRLWIAVSITHALLRPRPPGRGHRRAVP